ncbi:hypothetical protein LCGC14_0393140 [marine sediment metagenome]|uniref:Uncharacterized protein n=1 Tax=marine sediment metagenome TaxID=412755 RepID=A0A0F9W829_9ZZZZ
MSRRKDQQRANQFIYRDGIRVPRQQYDQHQEAGRLKALGMVRGQDKIITPKEYVKEKLEGGKDGANL